MQRTMSWLLVGVLAAGLSAGCSRDRTVVRRETSTYVSDDDGFGPDRTVERSTTTRVTSDPVGDATVEERRTTKTVEVREDDDAPRGVLSTTVHFLGEIIALPFRLVGGLIRAIF